MTEPQMVFWSVKRLAEEFNMSRSAVGRLLKSLGAKKWSRSSNSSSRHWFWEDEP